MPPVTTRWTRAPLVHCQMKRLTLLLLFAMHEQGSIRSARYSACSHCTGAGPGIYLGERRKHGSHHIIAATLRQAPDFRKQPVFGHLSAFQFHSDHMTFCMSDTSNSLAFGWALVATHWEFGPRGGPPMSYLSIVSVLSAAPGGSSPRGEALGGVS